MLIKNIYNTVTITMTRGGLVKTFLWRVEHADQEFGIVVICH